jgi:DNA replicative helicase MCM subunit Mcm2 (Cdc46/Mcm family)
MDAELGELPESDLIYAIGRDQFYQEGMNLEEWIEKFVDSDEADRESKGTDEAGSIRQRIRIVRSVIKDAGMGDSGVPKSKIVDSAREENISEDETERILTKLQERGEVWVTESGKYALI